MGIPSGLFLLTLFCTLFCFGLQCFSARYQSRVGQLTGYADQAHSLLKGMSKFYAMASMEISNLCRKNLSPCSRVDVGGFGELDGLFFSISLDIEA